MAPKQAKFGRKREAAITALMTQPTIELAARVAGVPKRTLYRWQREPEFQEAYQQAGRTAVAQAVARLQSASSAAASTLLKLMVDPATPAPVRARVADSILNHALKATEMEDSEARARSGERNSNFPAEVYIEILADLACVPNVKLNAKESVDSRLDQPQTLGPAQSSPNDQPLTPNSPEKAPNAEESATEPVDEG